MLKFYLSLFCLLFLAGCSYIRKPLSAVRLPGPMAEEPLVMAEEPLVIAEEPLNKEQVSTEKQTEEPKPPVDDFESPEPVVPEKLEPDLETGAANTTVTKVPESKVDEDLDGESDRTDPPTEEPDIAESDVTKPVLEKDSIKKPEAQKPEVAERTEDEPPEKPATTEPADKEIVTKESDGTESEPTLPEPRKKETVYEKTTSLTVVSLTGAPLYFFSADQLESSVPPAQAKRGARRYRGPKELDLWRAPLGASEVESSVLEWVGSVSLSGDASSYMLFCSNGEATPGKSEFLFVLLPGGLDHVPASGMCFVNLSPWDLKPQIENQEFVVPLQSHYDFQASEIQRGKYQVVVNSVPKGQAAVRAFAGEISRGNEQAATILMTANSSNEGSSIRMQTLGASTVREKQFVAPQKVLPQLQNVEDESLPDTILQIQPIVSPQRRTY